MHGLFGDLTTMPLKDLVVYLANKRASGTLSFERDLVRKQVLLLDGQVVNASSNEPREYLGQFLINLGQISEEQFHRAYQTQKETRIFLGRILVMIGAVSEETVLSALSLKMREAILSAFQWPTGTFAFEADKKPELPQGLELTVPLIDIHKEGEFRETAWKVIRQAFPSGGSRLSVKRENLPEQPREGSLDGRLVALIEGGSTIDELILALHATDFFLYQRLYALHRLEAVAVSEPAPAVPAELSFESLTDVLDAADAPSPASQLQNARTFFEKGAYRDALALARRVNAQQPSGETAQLLQRIEEGWLAQLRQRLSFERTPLLGIPPSKARTLPLSAPERYLISRIDGRRTLGAIISVAPLRELDALALLERFISQGWVTL